MCGDLSCRWRSRGDDTRSRGQVTRACAVKKSLLTFLRRFCHSSIVISEQHPLSCTYFQPCAVLSADLPCECTMWLPNEANG